MRLLSELDVSYGIPNILGKPRVSAMPYLYDIAEGNVTGHTPWSKLGYSPTMNTSESDIWSYSTTQPVYLFPVTAQQMEVVSLDNTQDVGTIIKNATCDAGGSTTTLIDADVDFTAATAVAVGDCIIIDKSGTSPEFGYVTAIAAHQLTFSNGLSLGGSCITARAYTVIDKSAKTGAHAVHVNYLDGNYVEKSEIVILNGTTVVPTVNTDLYRIQSFRVIATGTDNKCKGGISIRNLADTPVYSYITAGYTRARNIMCAVPAGKNLFVIVIAASYATTGNPNKEYARIYTRANIDPTTKFNTGSLFYPFTDVVMQNATSVIELNCPTKLPPKTDIKLSGTASAAGIATVSLRGWMEPI
jgi:hypothetical protein